MRIADEGGNMKKDSLLLKYSFVTYMDRKEHTTENCKYEELSTYY